MIKITDKTNCCGCSACVQCCPKQCITMCQDEEGFNYPIVNSDECIACGLCEKVCPILNCGESKKPLKVYAVKNRNEEIRLRSSSGGIFTVLAEVVIRKGGVVFGVAFDRNWNAVHTYTEDIEGLAAFRGSKYVQSEIGSSYKQVRLFLKNGREVLFTGTSCQIAGLKRFLIKDYPNLLTLEILCHGVPSPKVWQRYLAEKKAQFQCENICKISFRDKGKGWTRFNLVIDFKSGNQYVVPFDNDIYFKGFLANLYLRPSCYSCKCKNGRSGSDITIADYWNIDAVLPEFNDNKGVSLVLINSKKGEDLYSNINGIKFEETEYEISKGKNGGFAENIPVHPHRKSFFKKYKSVSSISFYIEKKLQPSLIQRIKNRLRHVI